MEQLRRSLQLIRFAIIVSIIAIAVMTWAFVTYLDAPAVPLVPLAGLVILVDLGMLIAFTRQRKRAIAAAQDGHAGLPG